MLRKIILVAFSIYLLSGCAATGVQVKEENLKSFVEGKTTIEEVVNALGEPTSTMRNSDGTKILMYIYMSSTVRPETFIPIVGGFVGGADTKSSNVMLNFNQSGVLQSYSTSESNMGTGSGLSSQTSFQDRSEQPRKTDQ